MVLDGVHRLDAGALSVLRRLLHDRELHLPDGSQLLDADRLRDLCKARNLPFPPPPEIGLLPIHPSFRIMAIAEPPAGGQQWLTDETQTMFFTVSVPTLTLAEQEYVIQNLAPKLPSDTRAALMRVAEVFTRQTEAGTALEASARLSLRQLLRVARRMERHPDDCLYSALLRLSLARFMPRTARSALDAALTEAGVSPIDIENVRWIKLLY